MNEERLCGFYTRKKMKVWVLLEDYGVIRFFVFECVRDGQRTLVFTLEKEFCASQ